MKKILAYNTHLPTNLPPIEDSSKERSWRLVTFQTLNQSDEELCEFILAACALYICKSTYDLSASALVGNEQAGRIMAKLLLLWRDDALFKQSQYKTASRCLLNSIWTFESQLKFQCS